MKTGILLLNLGGPHQLQDVKPFLYNLFSDPDILIGIPTPFRQVIAFFISQLKAKSSIEAYAKIGGGSPQLKWTQVQANQLEEELKKRNGDFKIAIGMRAWTPFIEDGLEELRTWGAEKLVLLPLFPQYSFTTTGSCFKEAERWLEKWNWRPQLVKVDRWPEHPVYIQMLLEGLEAKLKELKQLSSEPYHILFSAHSLPLKIVEKGDPYPKDVETTMHKLTKDLSHPWSLAFQSRNGKLPWLEPYTEDEIVRLGKSGIKNLIVVPISFVSDHIETLFELDMLYFDLAKEHGIKNFLRTPSFNNDPRFISLLASLVV